MRRLKRLLAAAFVVGAAVVGAPALAYEYKFVCHTKELAPQFEVSGSFEVAADSMRGEGEVAVRATGTGEDYFPAVTFYRGMWTTDRLSFHLRSDAGEQIAVVIVEDFFRADPFAARMRPGSMQGAYGNSALTCYNRSCAECLDEPRPSAHCRDVCGCTSPFCGAW